MSEALKHFALKGKTPRVSQKVVIEAIEQAFVENDTVILEAPVGSGKSAIAMTLAKWLGTSHILTPRKSLQDQYYNDFSDDVVIMKGKSGYPCIPRLKDLRRDPSDRDENSEEYSKVVSLLKKRIPIIHNPEIACDIGPCSNDSQIKKRCTQKYGKEDPLRPCPYDVAKQVAQNSDHVIHNPYSFFFQNYYSAQGFDDADIMIIDEAHDLEGVVRGFLQTVIRIPYAFLSKKRRPHREASIREWAEWFLDGFGINQSMIDAYSSELEGVQPPLPRTYVLTEALKRILTARGEWSIREIAGGTEIEKPTFQQKFALAYVKLLDVYSELELDQYIVSELENKEKDRWEFTFTPVTLMGRPESMFLSYGRKRLLMSGTIYDRNTFCNNLGLNPKDVSFIRIDSEFPVKRRPIFAYEDLMTDNSFASWKNTNAFSDMIENIRKIMDTYEDQRGLIHAPSYSSMRDIEMALNDDRIVTHRPDNFLSVLDYFTCDTDNNQVLISPVCQQGVDFKYDIARFQMVLRVPYLNTSDEFVDFMRKTRFSWYNYQSLIIFGQQIGRVMRSGDDWGHTYLLDERFKKYLKSNSRLLPQWLKAAIQYR